MAGAGRGEDGEPGELDGGDAEVAAARVDAECPALQVLRVEGVDVGHGGGEVAAAEATEAGAEEQGGVGDAGFEEGRGGQDRDQQEQGAHHRPDPPAEDRDGAGVRHPQAGADGGGQGGQQELAGRVHPVLRAEEQDEDRPQAPHREADVLGEDGPEEVAAGGPGTGRGPEDGVLGVPGAGRGGRRAQGGGHGGPFGGCGARWRRVRRGRCRCAPARPAAGRARPRRPGTPLCGGRRPACTWARRRRGHRRGCRAGPGP